LAAITSKAWVPIEPVEPNMAILFLVLFVISTLQG
jgi:hypothetical protein